MNVAVEAALPGRMPAAFAELLPAAARCWRAARDRGAPVQQRLHALLSPYDADMLAPVLDSLMIFCELALGRPLAVGREAELSEDERLLIGMVDGSRPRGACIDCRGGAASALDCAICSTRIMFALAGARPH